MSTTSEKDEFKLRQVQSEVNRMKRGMKNLFYKYKCYPEEIGLNIGEGEDVFKLRTTLAEKTVCEGHEYM